MLFDYHRITREFITASVDAAITEGEAALTEVVQATGARTWDNTITPLERTARKMADVNGEALFPAHVSTDPEIRNVAREQQERLEKWQVELPFRPDLYAAFKAFTEAGGAEVPHGEARRLIEFWARDFRDAGHELGAEARAELQGLSQRLVELSVRFAQNLAEHEDALVLTNADLGGLPDPYVNRLQTGDEPDTYKVTMAYPDVIPFLEHSSRRDLREQLNFKFQNRAVAENRPLLEEAVATRYRIAKLFGLPSWADHRMKDKMAANPKTVWQFYEGLLEPLTSKGRQERAVMARLLKDETGDDRLEYWDRLYYHTLQLKQDYGVDPMLVAQYFPLEPVVQGMFDLTGEVFGLNYEQIPAATAWHPDVRLYRITDRQTGDLIAYFYADLFPREGKYSHAAAFPLVPARREDDGSRTVPVSAIVANLTKPTAEEPSLLQHDEVVTLFHEFGHILHMSLSQAAFVRFSAASTEWDFVEAPSQIMEHWCWKPEVLARFARHHQSGEPIPGDLVERLTAARRLDIAIFTLRQMSFGHLDLWMHGPDEERDLDEILDRADAISLFPRQEGTFHPASFGHLMGGYDAGYYGYLWAEVFGDDMFSRFEEEGMTNPVVGTAYRRAVLEPNGSKDGWQLLRDFLGREPNNAAFLRKLGIAA